MLNVEFNNITYTRALFLMTILTLSAHRQGHDFSDTVCCLVRFAFYGLAGDRQEYCFASHLLYVFWAFSMIFWGFWDFTFVSSFILKNTCILIFQIVLNMRLINCNFWKDIGLSFERNPLYVGVANQNGLTTNFMHHLWKNSYSCKLFQEKFVGIDFLACSQWIAIAFTSLGAAQPPILQNIFLLQIFFCFYGVWTSASNNLLWSII